MELDNQVEVPAILLAKGIQGLYFLTRKSEILTGQMSQAASVYFEVQLKAVVPGEITQQPAASLYSPWHSAAFHALGPGFLGSDDIYIDNFFTSGTRVYWWVKFLYEFVTKHTLLDPDFSAVFHSAL